MDLEIPVINFNGTFESMSIFDNGENTFYKFTNVKFGDFSNLDKVITSEYHLIDLFNKKDYNEMYNSLKKEIELKVNL